MMSRAILKVPFLFQLKQHNVDDGAVQWLEVVLDQLLAYRFFGWAWFVIDGDRFGFSLKFLCISPTACLFSFLLSPSLSGANHWVLKVVW